MHRWKVEIAMSNGMILHEIINSEYETANEVANELMRGANDSFHGIYDPKKNNQVCFRLGHVSVITLTPAQSTEKTN